MTEQLLAVENSRLAVKVPPRWEVLPSERDEVVAMAEPVVAGSGFRANVVIVVLESAETIEQLGARSVAEALAYPGRSHVCSDLEWGRPDVPGRVVHFLYEAADMCVAVTRSGIVTGTQVVEITASCDVLDFLHYEDLFTIIASNVRLKEMA
jgi:hypothetical protein